MLTAIAAGEREIVVAEGIEQWLAEQTRTPEAVFDRVAGFMAAGYAQRMVEEARQ